MAESLELAGPMVSRAAGFHDDARRWLRGEELEKARAAEPTLGANSAGRGRDRDLENGLCEVDGDGCSLLHGLLLSVENNGSHDLALDAVQVARRSPSHPCRGRATRICGSLRSALSCWRAPELGIR